ncbi:hypothetical protein MTR67_008784 [Solanum verrucosum]|uniref:Uncharacterized protein n=1 Tax=Solanum verrucosum TaxID=315347 RepID=A0AAF0TE91_SOLVR|nr:hypothetical protein MTR67_008784 [Solanum verrucosum]
MSFSFLNHTRKISTISDDLSRVNSSSDRPGLLYELNTALTNLKCNVVNAKVWTHNAPTAAIMQVTGEETGDKDYSVVTIQCKDRPKLLLHTIFTLPDMQYVIFHANVDAEVPIVHQECQIKAVMYADEIEQYADNLKLMNTYLIYTAKIKVSPTSYGKPIHKFCWILDKETVIEHIKPSNELEKPLSPPTKLNITTFDRIPHMMVDSAAEIGRSHHKCREITLCDNHYGLRVIMVLSLLSSHSQEKSVLHTLWEDFGEIEGDEIAAKMATEADLIVARDYWPESSTGVAGGWLELLTSPVLAAPGCWFLSSQSCCCELAGRSCCCCCHWLELLVAVLAGWSCCSLVVAATGVADLLVFASERGEERNGEEKAKGRGRREGREGFAGSTGRFLPAARRWSRLLRRSRWRIRGWGRRPLFKGEEEE